MKRRYVTALDVAVLDHPIFITAPRREKVECSVCGRQGYPGGRWQEHCRMGHHSCAECGVVMAYTKTGKPRRTHPGCRGPQAPAAAKAS